MTWDVFLSYASEDKLFARRLARGLIDSGLKVWFDEFALEAGDSLRRSIDKGLRESQYGIVILSQHFFQKEWPQRELDGLTARDDGKSKVIIPVWYKISIEDVRSYSPPLADKLSVYYSGSTKGVLSKLLRAIHRDRFNDSRWKPQFVEILPDLTLSILPFQPFEGMVLCAGRFPVTNALYERFVLESGHRKPIGEKFIDEEWVGPFSPWEDAQFSSPELPVVCVDFWDSIAFCKWASLPERNVFLPTAELWDYLSAEGQFGVHVRKALSNVENAKLHQSSFKPAPIELNGSRDNSLGVSDLFGNVWEWCGGEARREHFASLVLIAHRFRSVEAELRGGGFLDDLAMIHPALRSGMLEDTTYTRHSDLGFRVCASIRANCLDSGLLAILETLPTVPPRIVDVALYPDSYYEEYCYEERWRKREEGDDEN
ncbi:MAG: SUMF1/EgtB/PvdO family nonheme iron enzyme [Nitrososphaera sp.]|nr:SUMF1/EgtB/PvdO family nonheme iron enzyme [Nitrososphaera sp.]